MIFCVGRINPDIEYYNGWCGIINKVILKEHKSNFIIMNIIYSIANCRARYILIGIVAISSFAIFMPLGGAHYADAAGTATIEFRGALGNAGPGSPLQYPDDYTYVRDLNASEASQITPFSVDAGSNKILNNVRLNTEYAIDAGSYSVGIQKCSTQDHKIGPLGFCLMTTDYFGGPIRFDVSAGENKIITLPFYIEPGNIALEYPNGKPGNVHFQADVVDWKGNFIRNLTANEANNVSFIVREFNPFGTYYGGGGLLYEKGELKGDSVPSMPDRAKLMTYNNVKGIPYNGIGPDNSLVYRVLDISSPNGLRPYSMENEVKNYMAVRGHGVGSRFVVPYSLPDAAVGNYVTEGLIKSEYNMTPDAYVTIHFTSSAPNTVSGVKKIDKLIYNSVDESGLSFIKRFIQRADDVEYGYMGAHSGSGYPGEDNRQYPTDAKIVSFNGTKYMFINEGKRIGVFDISNPSSPTLKDEIGLSPSTHDRLGRIVYKMSVVDNYPFVFAYVGPGDFYSDLTEYVVVIPLDTTSMTFNETLAKVYLSKINTFPHYNTVAEEWVSGSVNYLITYPEIDAEHAIPFSRTECYTSKTLKQCTDIFGVGGPKLSSRAKFSVYKVDSSGKLSLMYNETDNEKNVTRVSSKSTESHGVVDSYLIVAGIKTGIDYKIRVFDLTNSNNPTIVSEKSIGNDVYSTFIDLHGKNLYVVYTNNKIGVYSLKDLPTIKQKQDPKDIQNFIGVSDDNKILKEVKDYLNIPNDSFNFFDKIKNVSFASDYNVALVSVLIDSANLNDVPSGNIDDSDFIHMDVPQFVVNLSDVSAPKLLGVIFPRQIDKRYGGEFVGVGGADILAPYTNAVFGRKEMIAINGSTLYRMTIGNADVWSISGGSFIPPDDKPPVDDDGGDGTPPRISTGRSLFSPSNLLRFFRRILNPF